MISKHDGFDLHLKQPFSETAKYAFTFISLFLSLIIIYGNSFQCDWHLDDFANIVYNPNVRIQSLSLENIKKTFYGRSSDQTKINRPLSYLTFALNYHISGTNVLGYHVVNFAIHYIASIFLFLLIYNTLQLPLLHERYRKTAYAIALLSVFFWATHPIQVPAVTYIVQRMTSMAGMFYIMALYFYLKGRIANETAKQTGFFVLCGIAGIFSFASKENALMLPVSLFLYDLFLIQGVSRHNVRKNLKIAIIPLLIILAVSFYYVDMGSILSGYKYRPFTLVERLLTEPRVILFYISLLLYPLSSRLTLLHDIEISSSLFTPWTTLPAIVIISALIVIAIIISKKKPLIAYCILFFFVNHLIEGSIIPLELIFEHRNYLPSIFFFVPVAIVSVSVLDFFAYKKSIQCIMVFTIISLLAAYGHTTHIQNSMYSHSVTLWNDNISKYPNLHRPHHNLGRAFLIAGFYKEGLLEMEKAFNARSVSRTTQKFKTYYNLGIYYFSQNQYDKALSNFFKVLDYLPDNPKIYQRIAIIMLCKKSFKLAEEYIKKAVSIDPDSPELRETMRLILKKGNKDDALKEEKDALLKEDYK